MKTKEEILKGDLTAEEIECVIFEDVPSHGDYFCEGNVYTEEERIGMIKNYAKRKCKEQRDICAKNAKSCIDNSAGRYKEKPFVYTKTILNAPEPKFE